MFHAGITDSFVELELFYPGANVFFVGSCRDVCRFEDAGWQLRDCVFDFGGGVLWWLLRRPLVGTVAENVLAYGTGGLNIDGSRIRRAEGDNSSAGNRTATFGTQDTQSGGDGSGGWEQNSGGRWPANILLDKQTAAILDQQSGISTSLAHNRPQATKWGFGVHQDNSKQYDYETGQTGYGDTGGASRFFFVAKQQQQKIDYLINMILPPHGKLFFQLQGMETP
jgi:hypothetical protein